MVQGEGPALSQRYVVSIFVIIMNVLIFTVVITVKIRTCIIITNMLTIIQVNSRTTKHRLTPRIGEVLLTIVVWQPVQLLPVVRAV